MIRLSEGAFVVDPDRRVIRIDRCGSIVVARERRSIDIARNDRRGRRAQRETGLPQAGPMLIST